MPAAGSLKHRVRIVQRAPGVDAAGQPLDNWLEVATLWASIGDQRGREFVESRTATVNEVTTYIRLRARYDLAPEMRVQELCHARREWNITSIRYTQAPRPETLLECRETAVLAVA